MKTLSLDLRERIVAADDAGNDTRETVASRFRVSVGMVKKDAPRGRAGSPRHRPGAAAVASQPRRARSGSACLPRRIGGEDQPDAPVQSRGRRRSESGNDDNQKPGNGEGV